MVAVDDDKKLNADNNSSFYKHYWHEHPIWAVGQKTHPSTCGDQLVATEGLLSRQMEVELYAQLVLISELLEGEISPPKVSRFPLKC